MRRKDREKDVEFAKAVIDSSLYAVLSLVSPEGMPYSIPISPARDGNVLYIHSANEGTKNSYLEHPAAVSLCFVSETALCAKDFSCSYKSAVVKGRAYAVTGDDEKRKALRLICDKYARENPAEAERRIEAGLGITAVYRIEIDEITGKARVK